jgi:hypothetical protein
MTVHYTKKNYFSIGKFFSSSGAEGVSVEGRQLEMVAKDDITFRSLAGGVELAGGVVLDTVMLPHGGGGYKVQLSGAYVTKDFNPELSPKTGDTV